jgi:gas vesicle protein
MHSSDEYGYTTGHGGNEFFIGLLCGTAVGAAIGLLLAPKSGAEMRHTLAESADKFRRRASETYNEASGAVSNLMEKSKSAVRRGRDKAESTIDEASAALRSETTGTTTTY